MHLNQFYDQFLCFHFWNARNAQDIPIMEMACYIVYVIVFVRHFHKSTTRILTQIFYNISKYTLYYQCLFDSLIIESIKDCKTEYSIVMLNWIDTWLKPIWTNQHPNIARMGMMMSKKSLYLRVSTFRHNVFSKCVIKRIELTIIFPLKK